MLLNNAVISVISHIEHNELQSAATVITRALANHAQMTMAQITSQFERSTYFCHLRKYYFITPCFHVKWDIFPYHIFLSSITLNMRSYSSFYLSYLPHRSYLPTTPNRLL